MAAQFERPEHSNNPANERAEVSRRLIFELAESIANLRQRAQSMGLFENQVFYSLSRESEILRVATKPKKFNKFPEPSLIINVNRQILSPDPSLPRQIFSEEYIIASDNLTRESALFTYNRGDGLNSVNQVPVIWATKQNGQHVFRGNQAYLLPKPLTANIKPSALMSRVAEAQDLDNLLSQLAPACEDARYPIKS